MKTIEEHREFWANIAKQNGWYVEPFYVQVWMNPDTEEIYDSVATRDLPYDIVVHDYEEA